MANKETAVQKKGETAIAAYDYGEHANVGMDSIGQDDITLPRLAVLQALSPQVNGDEALDGAKAGMLHINVVDRLFNGKEGVVFLPCNKIRVFTEWVPRKRGGGFVGRHDPDDEIVKRAIDGSPKFGVYNTNYETNEDGEYKGNDLVETYELYILILTDDGPIPAMLPCTSTKIRPAKDLLGAIRLFRPNLKIPMYAHQIRVTTVTQEHAAGKSYNVRFRPACGDSLADGLVPPGDELLDLGKSVNELSAKGQYQPVYEKGEGGGGAAPTPAGGEDEEPPF